MLQKRCFGSILRGAPLHYRRIAELALEDGLAESQGQTPEATMGAQLYSDIKRRAAAGKTERFRQMGKGLFSLAVPTDPLGGEVAKHNAEVQGRLRALLSDMDPKAFEHLIAQLLLALGFENVEVTKYSGDGGIDVRAILTVGGVTDVATAVQVKRWAHNVSGRTVRELRGGLSPQERGLIITLSDFTPDAREEAAELNKTPIALVNGDELLKHLMDKDIGVVTQTVSILQLDEESLFSIEDVAPVKARRLMRVRRRCQALSGYKGSKALAIWPMPGGAHVWIQSLVAILEYIAATAPTRLRKSGERREPRSTCLRTLNGASTRVLMWIPTETFSDLALQSFEGMPHTAGYGCVIEGRLLADHELPLTGTVDGSSGPSADFVPGVTSVEVSLLELLGLHVGVE